MLLREAVSQIRSMFKLISSDNTVSDRVIAAELRSTALLLIKRDTDKRKLTSTDNIFTEISCLKMKEVFLSECCGFTSPCGMRTVARSIEPIPRIAENVYGPLVQGVFSIDKRSRFEYTDPNRYMNLIQLYPSKEKEFKFFWKTNGYLYISDPEIEMVTISALFEEDVDLRLYNSCTTELEGCPSNPMDEEFKCPGYLVDSVLRMVRDTMLKTYKQSMPDSTENDLDESK